MNILPNKFSSDDPRRYVVKCGNLYCGIQGEQTLFYLGRRMTTSPYEAHAYRDIAPAKKLAASAGGKVCVFDRATRTEVPVL